MYKYALIFSLTLYGIASVSSQIIKCGTNEVLSKCMNKCPPTCNEPTRICILPCTEGCVCKHGFIRKTYPGPCISMKDCKKCGPNQIWQQCSDNNCKRTCRNMNKPIACTLVCLPGCSCQDGFVWNAERTECIPIDSCVSPCGDNQVWQQCSDNACKRTCENKNKIINCPLVCVPGCSCLDGYVWTNDSPTARCIPIDSCPRVCGPNQIWQQCSDNACKRTCSNKNEDSMVCPAICLEGCSCKPGFVWNEQLTACIPVERCPSVCRENQVWEKCSDNACKKTCENFNDVIACPLVCIPGCSCVKGTVWNAKLTACIPIRDCEQSCGLHQVWESCSDVLCRKTCKQLNGPVVCPKICKPGCSCEKNYVWNEDQTECIPISRCHACGRHQHWRECSDKNCRRTCKNIHEEHLVCIQSCIPGCSCNPGYIWNHQQTECILASDC